MGAAVIFFKCVLGHTWKQDITSHWSAVATACPKCGEYVREMLDRRSMVFRGVGGPWDGAHVNAPATLKVGEEWKGSNVGNSRKLPVCVYEVVSLPDTTDGFGVLRFVREEPAAAAFLVPMLPKIGP